MLVQETYSVQNLNGRESVHDDLKLLIESYDKCVLKLKDLSDESLIKGNK